MEVGRGSLSNTSSTHLVATDAPVAMGAAHPDDSHPMPVPLTNGNQEEIPLPHAAGLVAGVLPFDRASLEQAVNQFFDRLEDLGVGQFVEQAPSRMLPLSLTVIGTVTAVEVARRRLRSKTNGGNSTRRPAALSSEELRGFPELPGSWSDEADMSVDHLDELIERLNDGDVVAAERAFLAYEPYLRMAVRRQLTGPLRSKLDSMDIVQSVWADVLGRFREAGWRFADRSHLRAFLVKVRATG